MMENVDPLQVYIACCVTLKLFCQPQLLDGQLRLLEKTKKLTTKTVFSFFIRRMKFSMETKMQTMWWAFCFRTYFKPSYWNMFKSFCEKNIKLFLRKKHSGILFICKGHL